jgi:hypothetical protein
MCHKIIEACEIIRFLMEYFFEANDKDDFYDKVSKYLNNWYENY